MRGALQATWRMEDELAERIAALEHYGRVCRFAAGAGLYAQGEPSNGFHYVKSGLVTISIIRCDGVEVVLEKMGPKTICGEASTFTQTTNFSSATAQEPTVTVRFSQHDTAKAIRADPDFAMVLLMLTSLKQRVLAERLENMASGKPEVRILDLFRRLSALFPSRHPAGVLVETRLTHELIAAMTGLTRVTVTRTIGDLRQRGIIGVEGDFYVIQDAAMLRTAE